MVADNQSRNFMKYNNNMVLKGYTESDSKSDEENTVHKMNIN